MMKTIDVQKVAQKLKHSPASLKYEGKEEFSPKSLIEGIETGYFVQVYKKNALSKWYFSLF